MIWPLKAMTRSQRTINLLRKYDSFIQKNDLYSKILICFEIWKMVSNIYVLWFKLKNMIKYVKTCHQERVLGGCSPMGGQYLEVSAGNPQWGRGPICGSPIPKTSLREHAYDVIVYHDAANALAKSVSQQHVQVTTTHCWQQSTHTEHDRTPWVRPSHP